MAEREIAAYREFQQLSRQILDFNLAICRLRPPPRRREPVALATKAEAIPSALVRNLAGLPQEVEMVRGPPLLVHPFSEFLTFTALTSTVGGSEWARARSV